MYSPELNSSDLHTSATCWSSSSSRSLKIATPLRSSLTSGIGGLSLVLVRAKLRDRQARGKRERHYLCVHGVALRFAIDSERHFPVASDSGAGVRGATGRQYPNRHRRGGGNHRHARRVARATSWAGDSLRRAGGSLRRPRV